MEEYRNESRRPANPRRRKRSKFEIFKEVYLPLVIAALAAIMLLVIIIGSITRAVQRNQIAQEESIAASNEQVRIEEEAAYILSKVKQMALHYDFEGAVKLIDSFSGNKADYPEMDTLKSQYEYAYTQLVPYEDPNSIPNLSFNTLVVDPNRAFTDEELGDTMLDDYITTTEFENILQQLYDNNYILVHPGDFVTTGINDFGIQAYMTEPIMLPVGKKPIIITQTNVCYPTLLVDGDGDKVADQYGLGFANRLLVAEDGSIQAEYIDATGQTRVGAYDLVPILDAFVEEHPDFAYKGFKALLAVSGNEGVLGYRTYAAAENYFGTELYQQEVADATAVAEALKDNGYYFACYTYGDVAYGEIELSDIQADMVKFKAEVYPITGKMDSIAFAQHSDIADGIIYIGEKHQYLDEEGFLFYLGFSSDGNPWTVVVDEYIRQGRILVDGSALENHPEWFTDMFDATTVIDGYARSLGDNNE